MNEWLGTQAPDPRAVPEVAPIHSQHYEAQNPTWYVCAVHPEMRTRHPPMASMHPSGKEVSTKPVLPCSMGTHPPIGRSVLRTVPRTTRMFCGMPQQSPHPTQAQPTVPRPLQYCEYENPPHEIYGGTEVSGEGGSEHEWSYGMAPPETHLPPPHPPLLVYHLVYD